MRTHTLRTALATGMTTAVALTAAVVAAPADPAAAASSQPAGHRLGTTSLGQVLAADKHGFDKNWHDFDILDNAVTAVLTAKPNSPVALLTKGGQRATVFAPTDRAFSRLVRSLTGAMPRTEKATFRSLVAAAGVDTIEAVLLYHVVPGKTLTSAQVVKADGAQLTTAQGGLIGVNVTRHGVRLIDRDPSAADAKATPRLLDISKGNRQVAHGINRVLRPIDL
jgi:uncharacterized surface protein with fasciclin (FAS1) repeats